MLRSTSIALVFAATGAAAQGFEGAQVELIYHDFEGNYTATRLEGGLNYGITDRIGVQLDLGAYGYDGDSLTEYPTYGLHIYYDVTDAVAVGAFYTTTDFGGGASEEYVGLEAAYGNGPLYLQGYAAQVLYDGSDSGNTAAGLGFEYDLQTISSFGGFALTGSVSKFMRSGGNDETISELGVRYSMANGFYAGLDVGRVKDSGSSADQMAFTLGYEFGNGTRFDQRSYQSIWNAY